MNKLLVMLVFMGAVVCLWGTEAVDARGGASSFYVSLGDPVAARGSFYIVAPEESRDGCGPLLVSLRLARSTPDNRPLNEFTRAINTWYEQNVFAAYPWAGEPPWDSPGLPAPAEMQGYEARLGYLFSPRVGLDARWVSEAGVTRADFELAEADLEGFHMVRIQGRLQGEVKLSGPALGLVWCCPLPFAGSSVQLVGSVGQFTAALDWHCREDWFLQEGSSPGDEWSNLWLAHGSGQDIGYCVGLDVHLGLGRHVGLVAEVQYRQIVVDDIAYTTTIEGDPLVSEVPLPQELDFSGLATRFGIAIML